MRKKVVLFMRWFEIVPEKLLADTVTPLGGRCLGWSETGFSMIAPQQERTHLTIDQIMEGLESVPS